MKKDFVARWGVAGDQIDHPDQPLERALPARPRSLENERLWAHTATMHQPKIRLYPDGSKKSGKAAVWKWEILLNGKKVSSGQSGGSQNKAYTDAREALSAYMKQADQK